MIFWSCVIIFVVWFILANYIYNKKANTCKFCGWKTLNKVHNNWARGWNEMCSQAAGDDGFWCEQCMRVNFTKTPEEYKAHIKKYCPWVKYSGKD